MKYQCKINITPLAINSKEIKMKVELYQYYQRNICLDSISIRMSNYLKNILIENNIIFEASLQLYIDIPILNRVAHEYFSLTVNYSKSKGN